MTRKAFFKSEHQRLFNKYLQLTVQKGKHLCSFKTSSSSSSSASSSSPSPSPSPSPSDSLKRGEGFWRSHSFQGEQRGYHSSATEECKWGKYKKNWLPINCQWVGGGGGGWSKEYRKASWWGSGKFCRDTTKIIRLKWRITSWLAISNTCEKKHDTFSRFTGLEILV